MRQQYTAFQFDGQTYHEDMSSGYKLINATLDNDFYMQCIRGPRKIVEDLIPGRDIPYFYEIDDEPLEFEVTFAFTEYMTKTQIKAIARKLFSPIGYKQLTFGDYVSSTYTAKTPIYKVIFHGETDINYVQGANNTYIAYFTLTARADRPYGFNNITGTITDDSQLTITNTGDINFYPNLTITNTNTGTIQTDKLIRVMHSTNNSSITFSSLASGEVVTFNSNLKTLSSTGGASAIYPRWQKDDLYLEPGSNDLEFAYSSDGETWFDYNMTVTVSGEAPVYIYDTN